MAESMSEKLASIRTEIVNNIVDFLQYSSEYMNTEDIGSIGSISSLIDKMAGGHLLSQADFSTAIDYIERVSSIIIDGNYSEEQQTTLLGILERLGVGLQELKRYQKKVGETQPPPPPEYDQPSISGVSEQISNTIFFIDQLINRLFDARVVGATLKELYTFFRKEASTLTSPNRFLFERIMAEIQISMTNILFRGFPISAENQVALVTLWTQLIYLYNQITVLTNLAKEHSQSPPLGPTSTSSEEEMAPSSPPIAPVAPIPPAPGQSPVKGGSGTGLLGEIERGRPLRKAGVLRKKEEKPEWQKKIEEYGRAQNPEGSETGGSTSTEEEWAEEPQGLAPLTPDVLKPSESDTALPPRQVSLKSALQARISPKMEAQLIGHPLFQLCLK